MTPAAQLNAAIEALSELFTAWESGKHAPADAALERFFKARRFMGSKDRGAVAERVYFVLRHLASLQWWCSGRDNARTLVLAASVLQGASCEDLQGLCTGERFAAAPINAVELKMLKRMEGQGMVHKEMPSHVAANVPEWLEAELQASLGSDYTKEMQAMALQAPVDVRVNTLKTTKEALMAALTAHGLTVEETPYSPVGLRMHKRGGLFALPEFKEGHFEMQDEASQLVAQLLDAKPGERVIDMCAGAGGKTLAIAAMMKNKGKILAWDISARRMADLHKRLKRAGVDNVEAHVITSESDPFIKRHKQSADRVLVDAPCSGSGTWRRNPDLKWRTHAENIAALTALQASILESAARLVKPGGRLVYATCSLLQSENEQQLERFLHTRNDFRVVSADKICSNLAQLEHPLRLRPHKDGMDGFFAVAIERLA